MYDAGRLIIACAIYKSQLLQGNTYETKNTRKNDTGPTCVCIFFKLYAFIFLTSTLTYTICGLFSVNRYKYICAWRNFRKEILTIGD